MRQELYTARGENLQGTPWQVYPRPQMKRDSYINLNGTWDFTVGEEYPETYDRRILVPFCPESRLSGIGKTFRKGDVLDYERTFTLPEGFKKDRVLLHFGAVDQECTVSVNGKVVGGHKGGYTAFSFDITDALVEGENELTLAVQDWTEKKPHARGKQKLVRTGKWSSLFYTPQSGIWKTVWMRSRSRF